MSLVCTGTAAQIGPVLPPFLSLTAAGVLSAQVHRLPPMLREWAGTHSLGLQATSFVRPSAVAVPLGGRRTNMLTAWLQARSCNNREVSAFCTGLHTYATGFAAITCLKRAPHWLCSSCSYSGSPAHNNRQNTQLDQHHYTITAVLCFWRSWQKGA
jgi:hypothetical protein